MGCLNSKLDPAGKMVPEVPALSRVVTVYAANGKEDTGAALTSVNGRQTGPGKAQPLVTIEGVALEDPTAGALTTKKVLYRNQFNVI
jgi:hypothetical protein